MALIWSENNIVSAESRKARKILKITMQRDINNNSPKGSVERVHGCHTCELIYHK